MKHGTTFDDIRYFSAEQEFVFVKKGTNDVMFYTHDGEELLCNAIMNALRHERDTQRDLEVLACCIEQTTSVYSSPEDLKKELAKGNAIIKKIANNLGATICQTPLPNFAHNREPIVSVPGEPVFNGVLQMHKDNPEVAKGVITTATHLHANTDDVTKTLHGWQAVNNLVATKWLERGDSPTFYAFVSADPVRWKAWNGILNYRLETLEEILGTFEPELITGDVFTFVQDRLFQGPLQGRDLFDILEEDESLLFNKKNRTQKPRMGPIKIKKPGKKTNPGSGITIEVATMNASHGHDDIMSQKIDDGVSIIQEALSD